MNKNKELGRVKNIFDKCLKSILTKSQYQSIEKPTIEIKDWKEKSKFGSCDLIKKKITISHSALKKGDKFVEHVLLHEAFHFISPYVPPSDPTLSSFDELLTELRCCVYCNDFNRKYPKSLLNRLKPCKVGPIISSIYASLRKNYYHQLGESGKKVLNIDLGNENKENLENYKEIIDQKIWELERKEAHLPLKKTDSSDIYKFKKLMNTLIGENGSFITTDAIIKHATKKLSFTKEKTNNILTQLKKKEEVVEFRPGYLKKWGT